MKIERFEIPGLAQYAYIVSSDGKAVLIDPIRDTDRYTRHLRENHLTLVAIAETHIHADFASGATALSEATGAELALSAYDEGEHYRYSMPHRSFRTGDGIQVGNARLEALHTPGHTPEHLSFVLFDLTSDSKEPLAIFSGDFLFFGALGRPDLLGEEAKEGLAHELFQSLHHRLKHLPDSVQVYPGHGAGSLCGAGMSERHQSTLGDERGTNVLFRMDEPSFVSSVLASVPPMPSYYPRMKDLNSRGAVSITSLSEPKSLSTSELDSMRKDKGFLPLDLRRSEAFGGAHIPGAINIGAGQNLSLWAGWLLEAETQIVLITDTGEDEESRHALARVGLDHVTGFLAGGMPAWIEAGLDFERLPQLSTAEVEGRSPDAIVLDVRSDAEWHSGYIEGARHIMLGDLLAEISELPPDRQIITVCGSGYRSNIAASLLLRSGFTDIQSMNGGMSAWKRRSRPVEKTLTS